MGRKLDEFDFENLSDDDRAYFGQRPWLKNLYERVTGETFPEEGRENSMDSPPSVQQMSARNAGTDTSGDPSGPPDNQQEQDEVPEDYKDWGIEDLRDEIDRRNYEYGEGSERHMSKGGSKADLAGRLAADDNLREQDEEESEDDDSSDEDG
jgi:hypothetical protein